MVTVYMVCALLGGVVLLMQLALTAIGAHDGGVDSHLDASGHVDFDGGDSSLFFSMLSLRALMAAIAFFGIGGLAGDAAELGQPTTLTIAVGAGVAAMIVVAWIMRTLYRLQEDGTVRIGGTVGQPATVYLGIPGSRAGTGKVTVSIQGRTMEYSAVTPGEMLPTGAQVVVVGVVGPETLEVRPAQGE